MCIFYSLSIFQAIFFIVNETAISYQCFTFVNFKNVITVLIIVTFVNKQIVIVNLKINCILIK